MSTSSKLTFRLAVLFLGSLLVMGLVVAFSSSTEQAGALDTTEWQKVAGYMDSYIDAQYNPTDDGEAGFRMSIADLKSAIDSDGDGETGGGYLDEGDDAANAPLLVDVLAAQSFWIPATSIRVNWSTDSASAANVAAIQNMVANREAAGFNTDIATYCYTGHTESVVTGAYGAISQAGGFGGTTPPEVRSLSWGRYGWGTFSKGYANTKSITASTVAPSTNALATSAACTGSTPDSELVRCAAANALTTVGSGQNPWPAADDGLYQPIDIRSSIGNTVANQTTGGAYAKQVPLQDLFDATGGTYDNLAELDPAGGKVVFANRTQHTGLIAGIGARMLGYDSTGMKWGLPNWNNTVGEQFTGGANYSWAGSAPDTTAPTVITAPSASNVTGNSADISRVTDEAATMKVEYGTSSGVYTSTVNNTVLNANKTVSLSGLAPSTTYYVKVTSYDGQANGTASSEISFTTEACGKPAISLSISNVYWGSMAAYTAGILTVDYTVTNSGSANAYNVALTGSSANNGVTVNSGIPATVGDISGGGGTGLAIVDYNVPSGTSWFNTNNTASADDGCGNGYTYP